MDAGSHLRGLFFLFFLAISPSLVLGKDSPTLEERIGEIQTIFLENLPTMVHTSCNTTKVWDEKAWNVLPRTISTFRSLLKTKIASLFLAYPKYSGYELTAIGLYFCPELFGMLDNGRSETFYRNRHIALQDALMQTQNEEDLTLVSVLLKSLIISDELGASATEESFFEKHQQWEHRVRQNPELKNPLREAYTVITVFSRTANARKQYFSQR